MTAQFGKLLSRILRVSAERLGALRVTLRLLGVWARLRWNFGHSQTASTPQGKMGSTPLNVRIFKQLVAPPRAISWGATATVGRRAMTVKTGLRPSSKKPAPIPGKI